MTQGLEVVRPRLYAAYSAMVAQDVYLLEVDANERSITHKLAEHLQRELPGWNVDCEFNRNGDLPKRLRGADESVSTDDTDGRTVYPDIIVHRRGSDNNLMIIEAKKSTTATFAGDIEKLKAYKTEHGYKFAYAVIFPVGDSARAAAAECDVTEVVV